jgi:hypothetical protein
MKPQSNKDLIQRLKQQPKHGMADEDKIQMPGIREAFDLLVDYTKQATAATRAIGDLNEAAATSVGANQMALKFQQVGKVLKDIADKAIFFERRNAELNKSFGITSRAAANLGKSLDEIANTFSLSSGQVRAYAGSIKNLFPLYNQAGKQSNTFYQGMIQTQHVLQTGLGMSEDAANNFSQYAMQGGKNAAVFTNALSEMADSMDPGGTMGYFNMMVRDIADAGAEMQLQFGKIPEDFAAAALKAKKFGLGLKQIQTTAAKMLDIESSIGAELEYQLLSGKRLVDANGQSLTNAFRQATITGNATEAADIMNQILDDQGDILTDNLFARQQMAQLMGIEEQALASALQKRNIIEKAGEAGIKIDLDGGKLVDGINAAKTALEKGAIDDVEFKKLVDKVDTRTTDNRLDQILEVNERQLYYQMLTNQEAIVAASRKGVEDMGGAYKLGDVSGELKALGSSIVALDAVNAQAGEFITVAGAVADYLTGKGGSSGGVAEVGAGVTTVQAKEDVVSMPGTSGRVLTGPFGAFSLDDRDMIMAGDPNKMTGGGNNNMMQFAAAIIVAINNQTQQLKSRDNTFGAGINDSYYG